MVDSIVDNWSMRTHRRAEIKLDLSVKTTAEKLEIIIEAIKKLLISKDELVSGPGSVFLKEVSKNGITIIVEYFTDTIPLNEFDTIKQTINLDIKKILESNEVVFAGEANTIVINNEVKES